MLAAIRKQTRKPKLRIRMKKLLVPFCGLLLATANIPAAAIFSDNFTYPDGPLLGQGGWTITGTSTVNPIPVSSGKAGLTTTGQDAYSALPGGSITIADGGSLYIGLTLNLSAAQATGDYFLHFTPTVGNTSLFFDRLFAKSSGSGFVLGWMETSGGTVTPTYGTVDLSFGTDYRVVVAYNALAGPLNDTGAVYVDPSDLNFVTGNTPYLTKSWTSTSPEGATVAALNLRQGTAGNAPTLTIDDLNASLTFSDVATYSSVPEPSSVALMGLGLLAATFIRRRS